MDVHEFDELNEAAVKGWGEPYFTDETVTLWHGDALEVLTELPAGSVNCCVTSPPYFGLRDYGTEGQYGLEESPAAAKHGRKYVGIDLNAEYLQLSLDTRLVQPGLIFDE